MTMLSIDDDDNNNNNDNLNIVYFNSRKIYENRNGNVN